ncbi:MAG: TolC family protein [Bacteroidota bacterium]
MHRFLAFSFLLILGLYSWGQDEVTDADSLQTLSFDGFMERVLEHHPLSIQANIQLDKGRAELQQARGAFDPKLLQTTNQKYFDDKQYYSLIDGGFKIPTWFGIEVKGGYEQTRGVFLNPENNLPDAGLWYAGVTVPVGQGLFIEKRRASLQQAKSVQHSTQAQRDALLNELLYEAGQVYWAWFEAYSILQVFEEGLDLAMTRYEFVKKGAALGDRPSVDTLEAGIQVQNRQLNLQEATLAYINFTRELEVFLWERGIVPLEVDSATVPQVVDPAQVNSNLPWSTMDVDTFLSQHPQLRQTQFAIDQLEVDQRWAREQLKPIINVTYNALSEPVGGEVMPMYSINDYKWGLEFSFPIFLRKERGKIEMNRLKIQEKRLEFDNKQENIRFKVEASFNEWNITREQIQLYERTVRDYNSLLGAERQLFRVGESSLFLVNSRERSYLSARVKLIELIQKNQKSQLKTRYNLGILGQEVR